MPLEIKLAAVPNKPQDVPVQVFSTTTSEQISLVWVGLATSENGGSTILGYDLWRDDGDEGDFRRLSSSDVNMALSYTDRTPI